MLVYQRVDPIPYPHSPWLVQSRRAPRWQQQSILPWRTGLAGGEGPLFHGDFGIMMYPPVNKQKTIEHGPFIDGLPIKNGWFSIAMLVYQRVLLMMMYDWFWWVVSELSEDGWCIIALMWANDLNLLKLGMVYIPPTQRFGAWFMALGIPHQMLFIMIDISTTTTLAINWGTHKFGSLHIAHHHIRTPYFFPHHLG